MDQKRTLVRDSIELFLGQEKNNFSVTRKFIEFSTDVYIKNYFPDLLQKLKDKEFYLLYEVTRGMKVAGCFSNSGKNLIIKISGKIINSIFLNGETSYLINGLSVYDRLSAALCILEHELIHLYLHIYGNGTEKSHGPQFKQLSHKYFGHTGFRHDLLVSEKTRFLQKQILAEKIETSKIFEVGQYQQVLSNGIFYYAIITSITSKNIILYNCNIKFTISKINAINLLKSCKYEDLPLSKNLRIALGERVKFLAVNKQDFLYGVIIYRGPKLVSVQTTFGKIYKITKDNLFVE